MINKGQFFVIFGVSFDDTDLTLIQENFNLKSVFYHPRIDIIFYETKIGFIEFSTFAMIESLEDVLEEIFIFSNKKEMEVEISKIEEDESDLQNYEFIQEHGHYM